MSPEEKMAKGQEYITKGTTHFSNKEYAKAIAVYELALGVLQEYPYVRHDVGSTVNVDSNVLEARRDLIRCLSNIATCHLKVSQGNGSTWKVILKNCDQAIWVHDGGRVNDDRLLSKILYRRAEVYIQRSETVKAREDLERAYVCAPDSKSVSVWNDVFFNQEDTDRCYCVVVDGGV